jgi:hypothetical protein
MSARMMSSGTNSGAGLPDSFADYRPAAQVCLVYGVGSVGRAPRSQAGGGQQEGAPMLSLCVWRVFGQFSMDDTSKIPPPSFDAAGQMPGYPSERMSMPQSKLTVLLPPAGLSHAGCRLRQLLRQCAGPRDGLLSDSVFFLRNRVPRSSPRAPRTPCSSRPRCRIRWRSPSAYKTAFCRC